MTRWRILTMWTWRRWKRPLCKVMNAESGCTCAEAADQIELYHRALEIISQGLPGAALFATEILAGDWKMDVDGDVTTNHSPGSQSGF